MASQWFVRTSGRVDGPYTSRQLRQLVEQGRIAPDTEVRKGDDARWTAAAKLKGLLTVPSETESVGQHVMTGAFQAVTEGDGGIPKWLWALIGAALLVVGGVGFLFFSDTRRRADERRVDAAQREAAGYIEEAKSKMAKGNLDKAEELIEKALSVEGASDRTAAQTTLGQVKKARLIARAKDLLDKAQNDISSHRIPAAIESLKELAEIEGSPTDVRLAGKQLLDESALATSLERTKDILVGLSDSQFEEFLTSGKLPARFKLKDKVLDEAFHKLCVSVESDASREREKNKKQVIETAQVEARLSCFS